MSAISYHRPSPTVRWWLTAGQETRRRARANGATLCPMHTRAEHGPASPARCFGCAAPVEAAPGVYYCPACVERQQEAAAAERRAFDDFHAFADATARRTR